MNRFIRFPLFRAPSDEGAPGGAAAGDQAAGAQAAAGAAAAAKWFEAADYSPEEREWLTAKGLAVEDPAAVLPKLVKGHRSAEQRIGKGLDSIMDRPKEGQSYAEWARANAAALGLPEAEDGYQVERPEGWPKDAPWNDDLASKARKIAFDHGLPPQALGAFTQLYAAQIASMNDAVDQQLEQSRSAMMGELEKDWGAAMPQKLAQARAGAQQLAQAAGLGSDALELFSAALAPKVGDPAVMRMFAAVGEMLGEDSAPGLGQGGGLAMTAAEAKAALDTEYGPDSEWARAGASRDHAKIAQLKPRFEQLSRLASGKK